MLKNIYFIIKCKNEIELDDFLDTLTSECIEEMIGYMAMHLPKSFDKLDSVKFTKLWNRTSDSFREDRYQLGI